MTYQLGKFFVKYYERYIRQVLNLDPAPITAAARPVYDRLMHETPDMGGKGNMMASNMDLTASFFAYYEASEHRISGEAIPVLIDWLASDYSWLGFFTDMNKRPYVRPLYYRLYAGHAKKVAEHQAKGEWLGTWKLDINPEGRDQGICYHMSNCPLLAFVRAHGYDDLMPYVCKFDFIFERFLHAKLVRTQTEATGGDCCDYWFIPDKSELAARYKDFESV